MNKNQTISVKESEEVLREFAKNGLIVNDEALEDGIDLSRWVFEELQKQNKYYVNRMKFGGTTTKSTAIPSFIFEIIIYITKTHPTNNFNTQLPKVFTGLLNEFEFKLRCLEAKKEHGISDIQQLKKYIQFKIKGYFFHLIPAQNFIEQKMSYILENMEFSKRQSIETIKQIELIMTLNSPYAAQIISQIYESSLCEYQANFLESQNTRTHELIRLCKFWNNTLAIDEDIRGREYIISLLAVAAANITGGICIIQAFHFFLYQLYNFECIDVEFEQLDNFKLPRAIVYQLYVTKPIIKDPANPYINLANNISETARQMFKEFSAETLKRLELFETKHGDFSLEQLFSPQPIKILFIKEPMPLLKDMLITIQIEDGMTTINKPDIILIKPEPFHIQAQPKGLPSSENLQIIGNRINTLVTLNTTAAAARNINLKNIEQIIRNCIENSIPMNKKSAIKKTRLFICKIFGRERKFYPEVTYVIPYLVEYDLKSVVVSLKWKSSS